MGRTWAPKGQTPVVRYTVKGKRRIAAIGAVTLQGDVFFRLHDETIDSELVIDYIRQLLREFKDRHIVLLWDNSPTHVSKATKAFLEGIKERLTFFNLPPYFPELNPVEFVWTFIKWAKMRGYCAIDTDHLTKRVRRCVRSLRRNPELVRSYIKECPLPVGEDEKEKMAKLLALCDAMSKK